MSEVRITLDPECIEAENVREFHPEAVGAATGALRTMLDPEDDARAHRDADILASCAVSEALKALVLVAAIDDQPPALAAAEEKGRSEERERLRETREPVVVTEGLFTAAQVREKLKVPETLKAAVEEERIVTEQLLSEREGLRKRRPDLSRGELEVLLAPEDEMPSSRAEFLRQTAKKKLAAALASLDTDQEAGNG